MRVRSSRADGPYFKQLNLQCMNVECGATFGGDITITHGISPSAHPRAGINLRMAPPRTRAPIPANDDGVFGASAPEVAPPRIANDNDGCGEAVATGG